MNETSDKERERCGSDKEMIADNQYEVDDTYPMFWLSKSNINLKTVVK